MDRVSLSLAGLYVSEIYVPPSPRLISSVKGVGRWESGAGEYLLSLFFFFLEKSVDWSD